MTQLTTLGCLFVVTLASTSCGGGNPCAVTTASVVRTARKPTDDRAVYFVGGDSRGDEGGVVRWAFQQAKAVGARAFLFLGDMEWSFACDGHFRKQQVEYLSPIGFYPVLGNHEVDWFGFIKGRVHGVDQTTDAERLFQKNFLGTRDTPVRSTFGSRVVYSVDLDKGLHFIALDNVSGAGFGAEQLEWLERDLASARKDARTKHIVVGMHRPLADNCTGGHSMSEDGDPGRRDSQRALELFQGYGVSLIVASHVHNFAQFKQGGIQTYISGGLGAHLVSCQCGDCQKIHHFLQLDVSESDIRASVVRFPGRQVNSVSDEEDDEGTRFPDLRCVDAPSKTGGALAGIHYP
jgi:3',5'-cyclic AMP phosphodiesterase CpdA